jgi:hypothetical protein
MLIPSSRPKKATGLHALLAHVAERHRTDEPESAFSDI